MKFYTIIVARYFYNAKTRYSLAQNECAEPLLFKSRKAAREWAAQQCAEVYYLRHNEYSRPSYTVWGVDSARVQKLMDAGF